MGRVLVVEVLGVSGDTIWVSYPTADVIKDGTGVELTFHNETGFIGFHARVSSGPKISQSGIMLERAESSSHSQERRNWRVACRIAVTAKRYGDEVSHPCGMLDLTIDGAMIYGEASFDAGAMLETTFSLPKKEPITILSQIVYKDPTREDGRIRYGIRFVEMAAEAKTSLMWFLYEKIHESYPEQLRNLYPRPKRHESTPS
jgi:hypothetical protein